jgi:hypothetical protein
LIEVANALPMMTAIEFRRSLLHLVGQAHSSRHTIQNHNAWLKAAFLKNEGPLVTERMIEAQIDQKKSTIEGKAVPVRGSESDEIEVLQRYVAASEEERAAIDHAAAEKVASVLSLVSSEKHAAVTAQARIECAREFFSQRAAVSSGGGG